MCLYKSLKNWIHLIHACCRICFGFSLRPSQITFPLAQLLLQLTSSASWKAFESPNKMWDVGAHSDVWNQASETLMVVRTFNLFFLNTHICTHSAYCTYCTRQFLTVKGLYYGLLCSLPCTVWSSVHVVVVTDSAGVSGQRRGGRRDLDHRGPQVWECGQQGGPDDAEISGW